MFQVLNFLSLLTSIKICNQQNLLKQVMDNSAITPDQDHSIKDEFQRTAQREDDRIVLSKYEFQQNDNQKQDEDYNRHLDEIEDQIRECGKRLQQIKAQKQKVGDEYSEAYMNLEHERIQLKKRVIQLDYLHKVEVSKNVRESRRKQAENNQKRIRQAEQQRERRLKQLSQPKQHKAEDKEGEKQHQDKNEGLERSRRQQRMAEIQLELAQSRLRRSRVASLNAELDYLRATYTYPHWSDYYYPLYSPLAYPLTSSYLYPYSYPYRYKYWL